MLQRNHDGGYGEEEERIPVQTIDIADVALVRLVLAGAPRHWLWLTPEVRDLGEGSGWSALEPDIPGGAKDGGSGPRQERPEWLRRASAIWWEVRRLCRELGRRWSA